MPSQNLTTSFKVSHFRTLSIVPSCVRRGKEQLNGENGNDN